MPGIAQRRREKAAPSLTPRHRHPRSPRTPEMAVGNSRTGDIYNLVLSPAERKRNVKLSKALRRRHTQSADVPPEWRRGTATQCQPLPAASGRPAAPRQRALAGRELRPRENINPLDGLNGSGKKKTPPFGELSCRRRKAWRGRKGQKCQAGNGLICAQSIKQVTLV